MSYQRFYKVSRPPLNMPNAPKIHWGIAVEDPIWGHASVLHNTPGVGEHLGSLEEFAVGLPWQCELLQDSSAVAERFNRVLNNPKPYDPLSNNCQHTATTVAEGKPRSPTLMLVLLAITAVMIAVVLRKQQA